MSTITGVQGEFKADQSWDALLALLVAQIPKVDIQALAFKDFDGNGELVLNPPSIRVFFDGEGPSSLSDSQRLSYDVVGRFMVICLDQDYSSPQAQAIASAKLAGVVKTIAIGARLILSDGDISAPLTWISTDMVPVPGVGVGYTLGFEVPGLAQFPGANANPTGGN